jgi:hypothetical protein
VARGIQRAAIGITSSAKCNNGQQKGPERSRVEALGATDEASIIAALENSLAPAVKRLGPGPHGIGAGVSILTLGVSSASVAPNFG